MNATRREIQIPVAGAQAYTKDNVPVTISGNLFYRVQEIDKAVYGVQDYKNSLWALGQSAVRSVIGSFEYDLIIRDRQQINRELRESIREVCQQWGICCEKFEIQEFGSQNKVIAAQLERQLIAERERRENKYNTLAKVRTAEGLKQAAILQSEGELQARKNEADATQANRDQFEKLSELFANPEIRHTVEFLLQKERLSYLKAVAEGSNNSVYFVPESLDFITPKFQLDQLKSTPIKVSQN